MTEQIGYMTCDTLRKVFKDRRLPYSVKLNWRGEPLLQKDIAKYVHYLKKLGILEVSFNTNGLLLTKELIYDLAEAGLDWLIISIDGATKATYEKIRHGGDFEKVCKNVMTASLIYYAYDYPTRIRVQICKQPLNEHEIEKWKELFAPYSHKLRIGHLFNPQGKRGYKMKQPRSCPQPWQRITVAWNGNIYPCPSDYLGKMPLGNVSNTTIYQAWHSTDMWCLRRILEEEARSEHFLCRNCTSYC